MVREREVLLLLSRLAALSYLPKQPRDPQSLPSHPRPLPPTHTTRLPPPPRARARAVLRAIGVEEDLAHTSIRFGLGRFSTEAEVDLAADLTVRHVKRLREMSPLWEMVQEGVDLKSIQWTQEH